MCALLKMLFYALKNKIKKDSALRVGAGDDAAVVRRVQSLRAARVQHRTGMGRGEGEGGKPSVHSSTHPPPTVNLKQIFNCVFLTFETRHLSSAWVKSKPPSLSKPSSPGHFKASHPTAILEPYTFLSKLLRVPHSKMPQSIVKPPC